MNHIRSASDAVANDVKYHLRCWAAGKQRVAIIYKSYSSKEIDAKLIVIADIEIIDRYRDHRQGLAILSIKLLLLIKWNPNTDTYW